MNTKTSSSIKIKTGLKAAGFGYNHNRGLSSLKVKTGLKAAGFGYNHNRALSTVR